MSDQKTVLERVTVLETHLEIMRPDISEIKKDVKSLQHLSWRIGGMAAGIVAIASIAIDIIFRVIHL